MSDTVLVVEDNELNRLLVQEVLELADFEIRMAVDVEDGWRCLNEQIPDIVLMDIELPGGGGEALLARMRNTAEMMGVPVIAVTAFAMRGDKERLLEAGFDAYLSKPIEVATFGRDVRQILEASRKG